MRVARPRNYLGKDLGLLCGQKPPDLYLSVSTQSGLGIAVRFDMADIRRLIGRAQETHATSGRKKKCLVAGLVPMAWLSNSSDSSMITGKGKRRQIRIVRESQRGEMEKCTVESTDLQNNALFRRRFLARLPLFLLSQSNQQREGRTDADQRTEGDRRWMKEMSFEVRPFCG